MTGYFLTRLINLTILPIFTDEAIYLRWSQIMAYDAGLRFLPLTDGKPPLFFWLMMFPIKFLANFDILFAGRLTSVLCGFLGLSGVAFTAWVLFKSKKIAALYSIFSVPSPSFTIGWRWLTRFLRGYSFGQWDYQFYLSKRQGLMSL